MTQQTNDLDEISELANEVFSKCFLVLLAHVQRKIEQNPNYEEPRFLKAFMVAFEAMNDGSRLKEGQIISGVSVNDDPAEGYMVMFKKRGNGFEIYKVLDIKRNREVGISEIMRLMQASILLDNIKGEDIELSYAIDLLKLCVPEANFVRFPNNQWRKYRDKILSEIWRQHIDGLTSSSQATIKLRQANTFGEIPQMLRGFMASMYAKDKFPSGNAMALSSPENSIPKYKIMDTVAEILYGRGGDFIRKQKYKKSD